MVWLLTDTGIQVWSGVVVYGSNPAISCVCAAGFYLCSPVFAGKTEKQVITTTYFTCYIATLLPYHALMYWTIIVET